MPTDEGDPTEVSTSSGRGDFFAVDKRCWAHACSLGMNTAIGYLILARGTAPDQRTTVWSATAMQDRTTVPWRQCSAAVKAVVASGLVKQTKAGKHPHYYILPPHEVRAIIPTSKSMKAAAEPKQDQADWIWLPNAVTDGAAGETSPIEIIRQSSNVGALKLFVNFYHSQSLADYGGVHWKEVFIRYERQKIGEWQSLVIWGFRHGSELVYNNSPICRPFLTGVLEDDGTGQKRDTGIKDFWKALAVLTSTNLIEFVGHVITADTNEGTVMHPYGMKSSIEVEVDLAREAHLAGEAMLNSSKLAMARTEGFWLLPVMRHIGEVQLVGLARTRYRSRTRVTSDWLSRSERWHEFANHYRELRDLAQGKSIVDINGASKVSQR